MTGMGGMDGDVVGVSVADDGRVVADGSELVKDLEFVAAGVEGCEVFRSGRDRYQHLLRLDETGTYGGVDEDLDAAVRLAHTRGLCDLGG
jgi:hypothetical protein